MSLYSHMFSIWFGSNRKIWCNQGRITGNMDEDIEEMIELVEDANQDGVPMSYDYLAENVLAEQPAY